MLSRSSLTKFISIDIYHAKAILRAVMVGLYSHSHCVTYYILTTDLKPEPWKIMTTMTISSDCSNLGCFYKWLQNIWLATKTLQLVKIYLTSLDYLISFLWLYCEKYLSLSFDKLTWNVWFQVKKYTVNKTTHFLSLRISTLQTSIILPLKRMSTPATSSVWVLMSLLSVSQPFTAPH